MGDDTSTSAGRASRVALLIESASGWGSDLLTGIGEYCRNHSLRTWTCYWKPWGKFEKIELPDDQKFDGVLARITHQKLARQIFEAGIPAVNLSWYSFPKYRLPRCTSDATAAADMAAHFLASLGFRNFAYCPAAERAGQVDVLGDAFVLALRKRGYSCERFSESESTATLIDDARTLKQWLVALKKPTAVFAFHDIQARLVVQACHEVGLAVPRDVAVMGGERDEVSATLSDPPITSIDLGVGRIGFEAARILDNMMAGSSWPEQGKLIPPARIVPRQSTDWLAVEDELVATAIKFIDSRVHTNFDVRDVVEHVDVSRRTLEQRFKRLLGRTPAEEIRRARVSRAAKLLCETRWPVSQVALACGFDHVESLNRSFHREYGVSPSEYRKTRVAPQ